ncbi:MAG: hypothetical protein ACO1OQ_08445 [Rufibacter sp.]
MDGDVTLGKAWGKLVLVGFAEGMTLETRKEFLQQFHRVDSVHGETYLDSGVLTLVQLKANSTCFEAEKLMKELQKLPQVLFANPTFLQRGQEPGTEAWLGVTNEFLVSTEGSGTLQDLEALVQQTKTKIVFSLSDEIHLLSADKNATGHVLELVSFFNRQPTVTMAEPNLIFQFSPSGAASATSLEGQAKTSKETFIR